MNENDFRDVCAMFAMLGLMMGNRDWDAGDPYKIADKMVEARKAEPEEEVGIKAIRSRRKKND